MVGHDRLSLIEMRGQSACLASRLPLSIVWLDETPAATPLKRNFLSHPFINSGGPPRIRALDLSLPKACIALTEQWMPLISEPVFVGLRRLRIYSLNRRGELFTFALEALCAMPSLHIRTPSLATMWIGRCCAAALR